jgi:hypothetical protein
MSKTRQRLKQKVVDKFKFKFIYLNFKSTDHQTNHINHRGFKRQI